MKTENYKRIKPVANAVRILNLLAGSKHPMNGLTIAEQLNIPQPTVMTYIATLEDDLFIEKVADGYVIGQGAALLHARRKANLRTEARDRNVQLGELN